MDRDSIIQRTRQAEQDVLSIWKYTARNNVDAADGLIRKLDEVLGLISRQPGLGTPRFQLRDGLRSFVVGQYVVFYEPIDNGIRVLRVLHSARQHEDLL